MTPRLRTTVAHPPFKCHTELIVHFRAACKERALFRTIGYEKATERRLVNLTRQAQIDKSSLCGSRAEKAQDSRERHFQGEIAISKVIYR